MGRTAVNRAPVDTLLSIALVGVVLLALLAFVASPGVFTNAVGIVALGLFCLSTVPAAR